MDRKAALGSRCSCCCSPVVPIGCFAIVFSVIIFGQLYVYSISDAGDASVSKVNGGVYRGVLGYFSLQASLLFGILGYTLLSSSSAADTTMIARSRQGCRSMLCCKRRNSTADASIFTWLSGAWDPKVVPPLRLAIEGIGLFWLCIGFYVSACSLTWTLGIFRPKTALEKAADDFLCHLSPTQTASSLVFPLIHLADSLSRRRDIATGRQPLGPPSYWCSVLGLGWRPRVQSWWIGRTLSHWGALPGCAFLARLVRLTAFLTDQTEALPSVESLMSLFFVILLIVGVLSLESSLLAKSFSRNTLGMVITSLGVAFAMQLPGFAVPDVESALCLVIGSVLGYIVPLRLWIIVLQMESQRVGLLRNFLRYLSHEVRVPANVSLLAIEDVKACLASLREVAMYIESTSATPSPVHAANADSASRKALPVLPPLSQYCIPETGHGGVPICPSALVDGQVKYRKAAASGLGQLPALEKQAGGAALSGWGGLLALPPPSDGRHKQVHVLSGQAKATDLIDAAEESAQDVLLSISSMKNLLDRTLDLARFDAGVHSLRKEVFDLRALLGQLHRETLQVFRPSGVELLWDGSGLHTSPVRVGGGESGLGGGGSGLSSAVGASTVGSLVDTRTVCSGASLMSAAEGSPPQAIPQAYICTSDGAQSSTSASDDTLRKPLWVHGDPLQLRQSMMNILHNASKYTPAGRAVFVSLSLEVLKRHDVILEENEEAVPVNEDGVTDLGLGGDDSTLSSMSDTPSCSWLACCQRGRGGCKGGSRVGTQAETAALSLDYEEDKLAVSPAADAVPLSTTHQDTSDNPLAALSSSATAPAASGSLELRGTGEAIAPLSLSSIGSNSMQLSSAGVPSETQETLTSDVGAEDLHFKLAGTGMLVMTVRDTGRGMTPSEQRGIFTPFSRLHSAQEGTGLGLNIAQKAMRAHGGDVRVHSEGLGRGCTFTVSAELRLKRAVRRRQKRPQHGPLSIRVHGGFPPADAGAGVPQSQARLHPGSAAASEQSDAAVESDALNQPLAQARITPVPPSSQDADMATPHSGVQGAVPGMSLGAGRADPLPPGSIGITAQGRWQQSPRTGLVRLGQGRHVLPTIAGSESNAAGLPASSEKLPGMAIPATPGVAASTELSSPKPYDGVSVLVVDADTATRRVMSRLLKRLMPGCTVQTAPDGGAAVRLVREAPVPPAYITLDNQMPVMTGQEAAAALRAWGYRGRIVGVTGNAVGGDGAAFVEAGVDTVVYKPSTAAKLAAGLQLS